MTMYSRRKTFMRPKNMCLLRVGERGSKYWEWLKSESQAAYMRRVETYGEALFDKVGCPIIVSQGREFVSGQVWDPGRLEDDIVQEKEENEREPRGRLFRVDIRSWVLCGTGFDLGWVTRKYKDAPWDRTEHTESERTME